MTRDEVALVGRVAAGDRQAFAALAEHYLPLLERFARRTLDDPARAQDIAQEVMLKFWMRAEQFDPQRAKLTTWLHQIAHNLCVDQFRLAARFTELPDAEASESPSDDGDTRSLRKALSSLPERQRTALVLTYYQALPNKDVAEIMGLSVRALESLLVRARKALRQSLEELS